jgi:hypothetical protein
MISPLFIGFLRFLSGGVSWPLAVSQRTLAISGLMLVTALRGSGAAQERPLDSTQRWVVSDRSTGDPFTEAASVTEPQVDSNAGKGWYAGIASGWYFPVQAWPTTYRLGGGGMFLLGEQINRHWAVQWDLNMWLFSGSGRDTWDLKTGPAIVWTPSHRLRQPVRR